MIRGFRLARSICVCTLVLFSACSKSNNLLLGRVEATIGKHLIAVADCYQTSVAPPKRIEDSADGKPVYRFAPCRDAEVLIRGEELIVNGKFYGEIQRADTITVDHGKVLINEREARVVAIK